MGAQVAAYSAVHYPNAVDRLVLVDGAGYKAKFRFTRNFFRSTRFHHIKVPVLNKNAGISPKMIQRASVNLLNLPI
jgi:pimeloyl-ACP methyl ester carboxylesterase